jgi:WS/DGAT/MGAT family acyltransferase
MGRWASGIDTAWLQLDQDTNRMVIHGVLFFEGAVDVEELRERIARCWLSRYPGLRQRPTWPLGPLGPARWVDVPEVALDKHVQVEKLGGSGDDRAVRDYVSSLLAHPLPSDRPLWRLRVLSGYQGRGTAMVVSIHHGLADGVALIHLLYALDDHTTQDHGPEADGQAEPTVFTAAPAHRSGPPHDVRRLGHEGISRARHTVSMLRDVWTSQGRAELAATTQAVADSARTLAMPRSDAATALRGELGTAKQVAWTAPLALATVRSVARARNASVNDVLQAVIAGGLRNYLSERDEGRQPPALRAVVPVNLRSLDQPIGPELGNEFGLVLPTLPVDEPDPARRIDSVHAIMADLKRTNQAAVIFGGIASAGLGAPSWTRALIARYADSASLIITNVPGPRRRLTFAGVSLRDMIFWVPMSGSLPLGVSILSYAGSLMLGLAADAGIIQDLDVLAGHVETELRAACRAH